MDRLSQATPGVGFSVLGRVFGLATPTDAVAGEVARIFPAAAQPLAGAHEMWALRRNGDAWVVEPPGLPIERFDSLSLALDALEFLVTSRLLALHHSTPQIHASGAVPRNHAVLAIGQSGAGKSSIALNWSRTGIPVLGDDVVLIDHQTRAVAFPRLFSVDRARLASAGIAADLALQWGEPDDEARYDPASGGGWATPAPIGVIAFLRRVARGAPVTQPISKARALSLLAGALLPTGSAPDRCFDQLVAMAEHARAVDLTFSDAGQGASALAALSP